MALRHAMAACAQCLRPETWLNDEVVNMYMQLLAARDKEVSKPVYAPFAVCLVLLLARRRPDSFRMRMLPPAVGIRSLGISVGQAAASFVAWETPL